MTTTTTLTRQQLYDRVWETPMVKLSAELGLSDRGLAKLCERHGIPVPGRGHWALTRAGYVMDRDPLPTTPPPETEVSITGDPDKAKEENPEVAAQVAYEQEHTIEVSDRLDRPHRLVVQTRDALRPRSPEGNGTLWTRACPLAARVSPKQLPRALRILDALLKACEQRGFSMQLGTEQDPRAKVVIHGMKLDFHLEEHSKRTDHVLNKREEEERRLGRGWGIPQYDYAPDGVFTFTIDEYTEGLQHRWSDRKNRPLESRLNEIIIAFFRIAVTVLKPRHLRWEEEERQRHEAEKRWFAEQERLRLLNKNLEAWRTNQELRSFLAALEAAATKRLGPGAEDTPMEQWLRWAHDLADRTDPFPELIESMRHAQAG
jgi:hypothetical protein